MVGTTRQLIAVEKYEKFEGIFHISLPEPLIQQCRTEAQWSSFVEIVPNEMMQFTTAKTTMGFVPDGNIGVFGDFEDFDRWREIIAPCADSLTESAGGMAWDGDVVEQLIKASPSGQVIFEENINSRTGRPVLIRDMNSPDWAGFFRPSIKGRESTPPAKLPEWLR